MRGEFVQAEEKDHKAYREISIFKFYCRTVLKYVTKSEWPKLDLIRHPYQSRDCLFFFFLY